MKALTAFASGCNEAREIKGFALAGFPVGASASNLREAAIKELLRVEGPVFLDSGAFSEVQFSSETGKLEITNPISPREWPTSFHLHPSRPWPWQSPQRRCTRLCWRPG
jgi:hypothetical protein